MPTWVSFTGATTAAATGYLQTPGDPANLLDAIADITPPVTDEWAVVKATENAIIHAIFAALDANGIAPFPGGAYEPVPAAAVNGNFASFDASRLVVDSGKKAADFALVAHNHDMAYAALAHNHNTLYPALVSPSVAGNFVSFSGITGAQSDSGYNAASFAVSAHTHYALSQGAGIDTFSYDGSTAQTVTLDMHSLNTWQATQTWRAGTTAAGTAPQKFQPGTAMTTPEAGALEWDGLDLWITAEGGDLISIGDIT